MVDGIYRTPTKQQHQQSSYHEDNNRRRRCRSHSHSHSHHHDDVYHNNAMTVTMMIPDGVYNTMEEPTSQRDSFLTEINYKLERNYSLSSGETSLSSSPTTSLYASNSSDRSSNCNATFASSSNSNNSIHNNNTSFAEQRPHSVHLQLIRTTSEKSEHQKDRTMMRKERRKRRYNRILREVKRNITFCKCKSSSSSSVQQQQQQQQQQHLDDDNDDVVIC